MRNLLALIGLLVVVFGGLGWYLGWYKVHVSKAPDGNLRIEADVDTKKVSTDTGDAAKKVGAFIGDAVEKGAQDAKTAQPGPPGNTLGPVTPPQHHADENGWLFGPPTGTRHPMGK